MKRGRPEAARGANVGPSTGENFSNPFNMGIDREYNEGYDRKTLCSPTAETIEGSGLPIRNGYNELWEGK